ncbi:hypothetical protein [Hansschlegelia zhihuaiae]|uniref:HeH/LEM domain-containing protein n=1 Tax=Hansschlegelia zhihuaiae TaxID=405005 RepID=A0A4Q0M433_9HYPH|nr:hypothetical protein [Hansschlegelia zhihuaiae]RXF67691.1 hypothetical protein EK403_21040 [Hansschlegelia zhihuaiae]
MLLKEKGKKDAEPVSLGWDEAQAALAAGTHVAADDDGAASSGDAKPDYDAMKREDLDALAAERGVDVSKATTKADVIAALKAADAS